MMGDKIGAFITGAFVLASAVNISVFPVMVAWTHYGESQEFIRYTQGHIPAAATVIIALMFCYGLWGDTKKQLKKVEAESRTLKTSIATLAGRQDEQAERLEEIRAQLDSIPSIGNNPGYVYVMRRSDGVLKLGKTNDVNRRRKAHQQDYGKRFELVKRFAVPDQTAFEKLALRMTADHEYTESNRRELRQMTEEQLADFLARFLMICREGVDA